MLSPRDSLRAKDTSIQSEGNGQDRKAGVSKLIWDKTDFKTKAIKKDKEGHNLMIKGSIQEEDITLINIYATNIGAPRYIQQTLTDIKGEIDGNTVRDFTTPLTSMDRSSRQKINKATEILKDTIQQVDLIDIFRTLKQPKCPLIDEWIRRCDTHTQWNTTQP